MSKKVDLFLSSKNIDAFNTFATLSVKENGVELVIGTTEVSKFTNPEWISAFLVEYRFNIEQFVHVRVYSQKDGLPVTDFLKHNLIGEIYVTLASLVIKNETHYELLKDGKKTKYALRVLADDSYYQSSDNIVVHFAALNLPQTKTGTLIKKSVNPNAFFTISRQAECCPYHAIWQSDIKKDTSSPIWGTAKISLTTLCNCDYDRPLLISVYDSSSSGSSGKDNERQLIGSGSFNANSLINDDQKYSLILKKDGVETGTFIMSKAYVERLMTLPSLPNISTIKLVDDIRESPSNNNKKLFDDNNLVTNIIDSLPPTPTNLPDSNNNNNNDIDDLPPAPPLKKVSKTISFKDANPDKPSLNRDPSIVIATEFEANEGSIAAHEPIVPNIEEIFRYSKVLPVYNIMHEDTFLEYVKFGCEISLVVAVDFTASNSNYTKPNSLHYLPADNPEHRNDYQKAIESIGHILEPYDSDKKYPVFGFGAKLKNPDGSLQPAVNLCFNLNKDGEEVEGVNGILQAYKEILPNIQFFAPTHLAPLLKKSAEVVANAGCTQEKQRYTVLLILTDGDIEDMIPSQKEIIASSKLPISIIIVGVGNSKFDKLTTLDHDHGVMKIDGVEAVRDIVQFVPYNTYKDDTYKLAQCVLDEVPRQFIEYMQQNNIKPNYPTATTTNNINNNEN